MAKAAKTPKPYRPPVMGGTHMVAAGHHMAAQAGLAILEAGGNAVDAGVATGLATSVLESERVGLASVAPIMIYMAETREVVTITGLGPWPKAASLDYFHKDQGGKIPRGPFCAVVPGSPDSWIVALEKYGTMSFAEVAQSAIRLARDGFPMYHHFAHVIHERPDSFGRWPATKEIFLPGGKAPDAGDIFKQTDLGGVMQHMADEEKAAAAKGGRVAGLRAARDVFYKGDIAKTIDRYFRENGGWITYEDLAAYHSDIEPPMKLKFGKHEVYSCGPWCQGPMLLQILALLDGYDMASLGHNSADYVHLITEAIKLAAADREAYYADPKVVDVPIKHLLSPAYTAERRRMIRTGDAWAELPPPGAVPGRKNPYRPTPSPKGNEAQRENAFDTSYMCVVDRHGNAFSATPSDGCTRTPTIPGTGLAISSRGTQSWANPEHPSSVAPGKRPRMTPNPAFAILDGGRVMPFGTPGGDVQPQCMVQVLLNITAFGMDPQSAVEVPRFGSFSFPGSFEPHDYVPGLLKLEPGVGKETGAALGERGHEVSWWPERAIAAGSACVILREPNGSMTGGADHRRVAYAVGW
jgi:gamma-glutamyltranspeptidase/glutathione hydrolase